MSQRPVYLARLPTPRQLCTRIKINLVCGDRLRLERCIIAGWIPRESYKALREQLAIVYPELAKRKDISVQQ